ncbi:hypothetical protein Q2T40_08060 [Winogradskyella maritima]|uniref:Uncharacterized protein n=1 Tax=Winogradskyella maritima TaxID=1517766 RepID=A0ABV8AJK9_9FLAO|nr:hypothetical protein [Winogradskyella maritima]
MEKNKTGKYLKYAIGEIILVVVGILIALQINNWNEEVGKTKVEKEIIQEIISDLKESRKQLIELSKKDSGTLPRYIRSMKLVEDYFIDQPVYNDSMAIHFTRIFNFSNIDYKITGYETLKSLGFNIIKDRQIRENIGIYFTQTVPQTYRQFELVKQEQYEYITEHQKKDFNTIFLENSTGSKVIHVPIDYKNLRLNRDFRQAVKMYRFITDLYFENTIESLSETNKLISTLEEHLNNY